MDASDTTAGHGGSIPMAGWMWEGVLLGTPPPSARAGQGGVGEVLPEQQQRSQHPMGMPCPRPWLPDLRRGTGRLQRS